MVERYARYPHEDGQATGTGNPADDLLRLGCLLYGGDDTLRHAEARALLIRQPDVAAATIYTAAAVGDVVATQRFLNEDPTCANRTGGPFDWEPLLYLRMASGRRLIASAATPGPVGQHPLDLRPVGGHAGRPSGPGSRHCTRRPTTATSLSSRHSWKSAPTPNCATRASTPRRSAGPSTPDGRTSSTYFALS